ncbi:hypothetical protein [Piscirickettsia litoralis]|uniref:Uncharacterized protein n=1 Tax=Piscirickettsia litoralis TaxID=1891921 RepID=A0ABX3A8J9_9GAMM|nr:hypothetical protein [Piscirickettsia litoralis]ODN43895.1 hypothetical protein BGC07_14625 [Piscirickettsia litoralis]
MTKNKTTGIYSIHCDSDNYAGVDFSSMCKAFSTIAKQKDAAVYLSLYPYWIQKIEGTGDEFNENLLTAYQKNLSGCFKRF